MLHLHKRMVQIYHRNVDLDIHHTFDHQEHMVLLQHVYQYHHAAIVQNVQILLQYSFVDLKTQLVQLPINNIKNLYYFFLHDWSILLRYYWAVSVDKGGNNDSRKDRGR